MIWLRQGSLDVVLKSFAHRWKWENQLRDGFRIIGIIIMAWHQCGTSENFQKGSGYILRCYKISFKLNLNVRREKSGMRPRFFLESKRMGHPFKWEKKEKSLSVIGLQGKRLRSLVLGMSVGAIYWQLNSSDR